MVALANTYGQTHKIDSLRKLALTASSPTNRMLSALTLCEERLSLNTDTLLKYANDARSIAAKMGNQLQQVRADYFILSGVQRQGLNDSVINQSTRNIAWLKQTGTDKILEGNYEILKGGALIRSNQYKQALTFYYTLLSRAENVNDTFLQIRAKNGIGWANMEMDQNREAINWFNKALSTSTNETYYKKYNAIYSNIAAVYNNIGQIDSSLYFADKAIKYAREGQDLTGLANALNIKASTFISMHNIEAAEALLKEAINIRKLTGGPFYTVSDLYQLSEFYAHSNQQPKGIATALEGIKIAEKNNVSGKLLLLNTALADNYKSSGKYDGYAKTLQEIIRLKDSSYQNNSAEALAELQTKYNVQKKENTIIQQQLEIANREYFIAGSLALLAILSIISFIVYRKYQQQQRKKLERLMKEQKDESAQAVTEAEESQRKRIAAELHDNIGAQISYITSNIDWLVDSPIPLSKEEQKERLLSVHDTSREMMLNLRETIWALNSNEIKLDEFADKLKVYIQTVLRMQKRIHFYAEEDIQENTILKPLQALNMFRIFQEVVTNALKHSHATQLLLKITSTNNNFNIQLSDNGIGFNKDKIQGEHYGLKNMRFRAGETGIKLLIKSSVAKGSTIEVVG